MILFEKAKEIFQTEADRQLIADQAKKANELEEIRSLLDSNAGQTLKKRLRADIVRTIDELFLKKDQGLISKLEAQVSFYNQLKTKDELDAINAWLEDILK